PEAGSIGEKVELTDQDIHIPSGAAESDSETSVVVLDQPLSSSGVVITDATVGQQGGGVLATFTDPDPWITADKYTALINWGDETGSLGSVTGANGSFQVWGSHTYWHGGTYKATVLILDDRYSCTMAVSTITVDPVTATDGALSGQAQPVTVT